MNEIPWYRVDLTDDPAGARRQLELQARFERLFLERGTPQNVAMYSTGLMGDAEVFRVYFSPATQEHFADFLRDIGSEACPRPMDVRGFLVGPAPAVMREILGYAPRTD